MNYDHCPIFDTHCHLGFPKLESELEDVLKRAKEAGITRLVTIGTDRQSSEKAIAMAAKYDEVYAVIGWHPCDVMEASDDVREELRQLASQPKVVAIGETGLDYHHLPSKREEGTVEDDRVLIDKQARIFKQHLEIAAELNLNTVIHQRSAFDDTIEILKPFADRVRGVFHCFVDTPERMRQVLALNSLVSFTGIVTFKNAQEVKETMLATPLDSLMCETDAPFLAPMPHRGKRCEPAFTRNTAEFIADARGITVDELSKATCQTAKAFYKGLE